MRIPELFLCPEHQRPLRLTSACANGSVPATGEFACGLGCHFPVRSGVPRCAPDQDYTASFGFEWNRYPRLQLDSNTGMPLSAERLERCLGSPLSSLRGCNVLEAGCGAGRFSEVLLGAGARVCALDLSSAVEANHRNHGDHPEFFVVQADLRAAPFAKAAFDTVICLGVLQHTPDSTASIRALASFARPGGLVVVDNYDVSLRRLLALRYLYRWRLKRMDPERAHQACHRMVDRWLPLHRRAATSRIAHALLSRVSPITSYYHRYPLSDDLQRAFAYLDTFDFHSPRYERLRTRGQIRRAMVAAGLVQVEVAKGGNGVEARGRVPECAV